MKKLSSKNMTLTMKMTGLRFFKICPKPPKQWMRQNTSGTRTLQGDIPLKDVIVIGAQKIQGKRLALLTSTMRLSNLT